MLSSEHGNRFERGTSGGQAVMDWQAAKASILLRHASGPAEKLGEGDEAEVYALGPERVIRFFKEGIDRRYVAQRRAFYETIDAAHVGFEVPTIIEQHDEDGLSYAVERRISGSSLADALALREGTARHGALLAYAETAVAIRKLRCPQESFGELLAVPSLRTNTWADFVLGRAEACLRACRSHPDGRADHAERGFSRLCSMLTQLPTVERQLVHGDYYPANVMIDQANRITGVIDFGRLTLVGDARMDAAGAVLYLIGMNGITANDREVVLSHLRFHSLRDFELELYRLFYAFRFLDTQRQGLLRWCVETIRAT